MKTPRIHNPLARRVVERLTGKTYKPSMQKRRGVKGLFPAGPAAGRPRIITGSSQVMSLKLISVTNLPTI